jgi:hypothetical protein
MKRQDIMEQELIIRTENTERVIEKRLDGLTVSEPLSATPTTNASIINLMDNTDWNWSTLAVTTPGTLPGTAGDDNNRAYNWYRIERATALLVEDDAHGLKSSGHSLFAGETADTPRWSKTDGWAELGHAAGTEWDIYSPLPNNFAIPSMRLWVQMLVRLRTATPLASPLRFWWAIYDNTNTAPAPRIIQGSAFTLDGAPFGAAGATTRDYKLIVDVDNGDQVESTVKTVNNTSAVLSSANGIALSWPRFPGFTNVTIYVTEGGITSIAGFIGNGTASFNDTGQRFGTVPAFPSVVGTAPRAYAEANPFVPTLDWALWKFRIFVPQTYNFGLTTGKQMLRGGVIGATGEGHQLQIDRLGVSQGDGLWANSAHDQQITSAHSTSQTGSTQGPPSGGGDPGDGEGRPACSTLDTPIDVCNEDGSHPRKVELGTIDEDAVAAGTYLMNRHGFPTRVRRSRIAWSELILTIETANGAGRRCSPSDLWLTVDGPESGTAARRLNEGMEVLTRKNGSVQPSEIVRYSASTRGEEVCILETEGTDDDERVYWAGDAAAHNAKLLFPDQF